MIQETELAAAAADRKPVTEADQIRAMLARCGVHHTIRNGAIDVTGSTTDYVPVLTPCYIRFTFDAAGQLTGLAFGY